MPAHAVTRGADADLLQSRVVFEGELVVTRRPDEIQALTGVGSHRLPPWQAVRRTLETTDPKALKNRTV